MKPIAVKPAHLIWGALFLLLTLRALFPDVFRGVGDGFLAAISSAR